MRLLLVLVFIAAAACAGGIETPPQPKDKGPIPPIEMTDVTPVWPLVTVDDLADSGFILAGMDGGHGVVFPRDAFDTTPALTRVDEPDVIYDHLTVIGARLDTCFQEGFDVPCELSVRL